MSPSYAPGWYPDPGGLWELRWWDGAGWTDLVATGSHQDQDPIPADNASGAIPPGAPPVLWSSEARTGVTGHTRYYLTPDEVIVEGGPNEGRAALYMVSRIDVRGAGDVAVQLSYAGYGGRSTYVIKSVEHPDWLKATIWRYAQLARRRHAAALASAMPPPPNVPPPPGTYTPVPAAPAPPVLPPPPTTPPPPPPPPPSPPPPLPAPALPDAPLPPPPPSG